MSEYYAVIRTENFLEHYGIRGMKWGVRKAIKRGNDRALSRQYRKALKKLQKLNRKADINAQQQKLNKMNKASKISRRVGLAGVGVAAAGTGTDYALRYINSISKRTAKEKADALYKKSDELRAQADKEARALWKKDIDSNPNWHGYSDETKKATQKVVDDYFAKDAELMAEKDKIIGAHNEAAKKRELAAKIGRYAGYAGAGVGAIGLGTAAITKAKAAAAKRRLSEAGHAKAVAERDAFKREMDKAFAGTKYGKKKRR